MSTSRFLPIANLIGCLLITGIIVAQWLKERSTGEKIVALHGQVITAQEELASEKARSSALENDVTQLKESIESAMLARKEMEETLVKLTEERNAHAATVVANTNQTMVEQTAIWEKAIAERDAKIRELNTNLTAARARLDAAIAELKEAGAR